MRKNPTNQTRRVFCFFAAVAFINLIRQQKKVKLFCFIYEKESLFG